MSSPSAPPFEAMHNDSPNNADIISTFNDPDFLKKMVQTMDPKTKQLYEEEVQKKKEERIRNAETARINEERWRQKRIDDRNRELNLLGKILSYIWLVYLIVVIGIFGSYYFRDSIELEFMNFFHDKIKSPEDIPAGLVLIGILFGFFSVTTMIMFTDM